MESTGVYHSLVQKEAMKFGFQVFLTNSYRARQLVRPCSLLAKNDAIDTKFLGLFWQKMKLRPSFSTIIFFKKHVVLSPVHLEWDMSQYGHSSSFFTRAWNALSQANCSACGTVGRTGFLKQSCRTHKSSENRHKIQLRTTLQMV